jgi:hypothetical protein
VRNETNLPLILESAQLLTDSGVYLGEFPRGGELKWRTVEAGETARIPVSWQCDGGPMSLLGETPSLVLRFRIGNELRRVEIEYGRVR